MRAKHTRIYVPVISTHGKPLSRLGEYEHEAGQSLILSTAQKTHLSVAAGLRTKRYTVHWLGGLQRTHGTHLVREARKDAMGRRRDEHGDSSDADLHVHLDHGNRGRRRTSTQPTRNSSE